MRLFMLAHPAVGFGKFFHPMLIFLGKLFRRAKSLSIGPVYGRVSCIPAVAQRYAGSVFFHRVRGGAPCIPASARHHHTRSVGRQVIHHAAGNSGNHDPSKFTEREEGALILGAFLENGKQIRALFKKYLDGRLVLA
jgi:hypothetical protein